MALVGKDKLYGSDGPVFHYYNFVSGEPPLPLLLEPGEAQKVSLQIGDDVEAAAKNGSLAQLKLSMKLEGPVRRESLVFQLNGEDLTSDAVVDQDGEKLRITYLLLDGPPLRQGTNVLEASLKEAAPAAENPLKLTQVRLWVRYKP